MKFISRNIIAHALTFSLAACQTAGKDFIHDWRAISQKNSLITVISGVFLVGKIERKKTKESIFEQSKMFVGGEHVGWIWIQKIDTRSTYIGLKDETIFRVFDHGEYLDTLLKKTGLLYEDTKLRMVKNNRGGLRYLDLNGLNQRCIYAAQLAGVGRNQAAFDTIMIAAICRNKSTSASAELDQQVVNLIADLRVDGSGKEMVQDIGTVQAVKPTRKAEALSPGLH